MSSSNSTWSNSSQPPRRSVPVGFLSSIHSQSKPIEQLSHRELHDLWKKNRNILSEPSPSTSTYHQRILTEQAAIEAILGMSTLESSLANAHISQDVSTDVSMPPSRTVEAKRRAIGRYSNNTHHRGATAALGLDEAMQLEQRAHAAALERQKQEREKRLQRGLILPGEILTREEREARIWAFMNAKPTESDEEDEDWDQDDDDDDDPSAWFEDEEDDGRKGQPLVDVDRDLSDIIRVDDRQWE